MKVTVCQFNPAEDTLDQALDRLSEHLVKHGSDFLLLPEMCFAPWLAADPVPDPQAWQDAVAMHEARIAGLRDLGVGAVVGTRPVIRENGSRRNQAYVWEAANGSAAAWHEKCYLPDEPGYFEHRWYDRGTQDFTVARGAGMKLGVQICTEMWFFEWARHYARSRVDLAGSGRGFQFVKGKLSSHDMSSLGKVGGKPAARSFPARLHRFRVLMEP